MNKIVPTGNFFFFIFAKKKKKNGRYFLTKKKGGGCKNNENAAVQLATLSTARVTRNSFIFPVGLGGHRVVSRYRWAVDREQRSGDAPIMESVGASLHHEYFTDLGRVFPQPIPNCFASSQLLKRVDSVHSPAAVYCLHPLKINKEININKKINK